MQPWVYFLLWGLLIFVMMRFGCGAHVMGHGSHQGHRHGEGTADEGRRMTPQQAVDPVCGMTVDPAKAKSSIADGVAYYFCSAQCREKFEAAPQTYLSKGQSGTSQEEHHHG